MLDQVKKLLDSDKDGMLTYEYLANNTDAAPDVMQFLIENICRTDLSGQFSTSAARFLNALNPSGFAREISILVEHSIEADREHRYIGDLLPDLWGKDYKEHAAELAAESRNFRRIYKRLYPSGF